MVESNFTLTALNGQPLYGRVWSPARPKAVIALIHGLGEHSGRYTHVAAEFNHSGYAVLACDLPGHGKTAGPRGVTPPFDQLSESCAGLLAEAEQRYPGKPRFLYGHSLGGTIVLYYTIRRNPQIAGVVSTSPALRLGGNPQRAKVAFGKLIGRLAPNIVMVNGLERQALSRDPQVVAAYADDPLVHDRVSARLGIGGIEAGAWLLAHAAEFPQVPLLLVHGTADRITSAAGTEEFASRLKGDVILKLWPGLYHETHNEPEKTAVLCDNIAWLDAHLE